MFLVSPSAVSLVPVFPGHYPETPVKARPYELPNASEDSLDTSDTTLHAEHSSPPMNGTGGDKSEAYQIDIDDDDDTAYSDEGTSEDAQEFSPGPTSVSLDSPCSLSSVEPRSLAESEEEDASSSRSTISCRSAINHLQPSNYDQNTSSVHYRMSDLPSIRSEVSTTFGPGPDRASHPLDQARCPSSLSLDVELVGLPTPNQPGHEPTDHGVFLDNDTSRYFGVDFSCLSQPDGMNAWTLALGTGSPLPSVSTSEETPRSGTASTFSSPGNFATTRYLSSDCSSPALSLDYYGLESTVPTPAYRTQTTLDNDDIYGDPSPPYEPSPIIPEDDISPQIYEPSIVVEEPKSQFKEVLDDMKRFGHKLKKMWKARPTLTLNRNSKAKSKPSDISASEIPSAGLDAQPDPEPLAEEDAPDYRSPPGLSELSRIDETEEEGASEGSSETPKIMESRRKLFKPQTMAEIKHIRRRTLPAAPLNDPSSPIGSPIIDIAQRRPRPRSLVLSSPNFANPADLSLSPSRPPPLDIAQMHFPEAPLQSESDSAIAAARKRRRWSTPLSFFSRP